MSFLTASFYYYYLTVHNSTVERGDVINILGMTVTMDRVSKVAIIKQKHFLDKIASAFNISKKAVMSSALTSYGRTASEGVAQKPVTKGRGTS